jgi:hypothetical protein
MRGWSCISYPISSFNWRRYRNWVWEFWLLHLSTNCASSPNPSRRNSLRVRQITGIALSLVPDGLWTTLWLPCYWYASKSLSHEDPTCPDSCHGSIVVQHNRWFISTTVQFTGLIRMRGPFLTLFKAMIFRRNLICSGELRSRCSVSQIWNRLQRSIADLMFSTETATPALIQGARVNMRGCLTAIGNAHETSLKYICAQIHPFPDTRRFVATVVKQPSWKQWWIAFSRKLMNGPSQNILNAVQWKIVEMNCANSTVIFHISFSSALGCMISLSSTRFQDDVRHRIFVSLEKTDSNDRW